MKTSTYFIIIVLIMGILPYISQKAVDIRISYESKYDGLISDTINVRNEVLYYKDNIDSIKYINETEKIYLENRIKGIEIVKLNNSVYQIK
jgi:hypothetical protein